MASAKPPLFIALFSCMSKDVDSYTKASLNKLLELLKKHHGKIIKRRWGWYCLRDFEKEGWIYRIVRTKHRPDGTVKRLSSVIKLTVKGLRKLVKMRVEGSLLALKNKITHIKNKYGIPKTKAEYIKERNEKMDRDEKRRLEANVEMVFKPFPA